MWKYLVVNALWFSILFLVHFFGSKKDQKIILFSIFLTAAFLAFKGRIDPIAWVYYVGFSCLVYYGAYTFRRWSFAEPARLRGEIERVSEHLAKEKERLTHKTRHTDFLETKADEIVEFYEQIKEMSRSLDPMETFLIFVEALSRYFTFDVVKLSVFSDRGESRHPDEVYELRGDEFKGVFDRSTYLKDRKKARGEVFPADQKVYAKLFDTRKPILIDAPDKEPGLEGVTAYPVLLNDKMIAIVSLVGIEANDDPLLFILIDRFIAEMQRVKLYERVEMLAITDGLTGVYVRRHLTERLEGEMDRSKRFGLKLSLLMIDVDHFKHFNDEYGHLVGDVVLKQVAQALKKSVREVDFVGRYGGEEFAVGLIETDLGVAQQVAERIRRAFDGKEFRAYGEDLKVTVSIGCATHSAALNTVPQLMDAADDALYQAKRLGRNRVCAAS
jgi:diguanylate cyclase (GGDEF)-like protein